jgi:ankyrin repeat protein
MPLELLLLELLHPIVEFLDSKKDISSFTRVSKYTHYRAKKILFRRYCGLALIWACENGIKETAQLALTYYREIKEEDLHRMLEMKKAFLIACEGGYVDLVKIMVNKGVLAMDTEIIGIHGLLLAAGEGHNSILRVLLEGGVDPNSAKARGLTPLKAAACEGHQQTVKILLDHGAAINCVYGNYGTALDVAAQRGQLDMVRFLLDNGANIDIVDNDTGVTPVAAAASFNKKRCL